MKTSMKQLTAGALVALLLVVGNVRAEGTESKVASSLELTEAKLEVESWMTDEGIFNKTSFFEMEELTEENLQVEDWMKNEDTWKPESTNNVAGNNEKETKLEIESWMTAKNVWSR
ncbi:MAG: hypothetical protein R2757_07800 [Draconibacterium sp.]